MPPLTRGPLPAGVYWRRRIFVLALAATLVFVIASVLGGGSDGKDDEVPAAQQAGGQVEASETVTIEEKKRRKRRTSGAQQGPTYDPDVLVEPDGNCEPADVRVTPQVGVAVAGQPVTIGLSLQTIQTQACYFRIGADKVTLKIMKRGREVWTSRECPGPIPDESIVVRRVVATLVEMTWDARESTPDCTRRSWLMDGDYTVVAAALGGEPEAADLELVLPTPETTTLPPDPKKDRKGGRDRDRDGGLEGETAQEEAQGDEQQEPSDERSSKPPRR